MKLIIGGAFQGKRAFVKNRYGISDSEILDGGSALVESLPSIGSEFKAIDHYHLLVRNELHSGLDPVECFDKIVSDRPDLVLISDEVGNVVVPIEREERDFREALGRVLSIAARKSDEVYRIFCGLGQRMK